MIDFTKYENKPGIYKITNTVNNRVYIGQSKKIRYRLKTHYKQLIENKHFNSDLQRSWNKYKEDQFSFELCCYIYDYDENILNDLEEFFVKKYDSYRNGFNKNGGGDCISGLNSASTKKDIYKFYHVNGTIEEMTVYEMIEKYKIRKWYFQSFAYGNFKCCCGWVLDESIITDKHIWYNKRNKHQKYYDTLNLKEIYHKFQLQDKAITIFINSKDDGNVHFINGSFYINDDMEENKVKYYDCYKIYKEKMKRIRENEPRKAKTFTFKNEYITENDVTINYMVEKYNLSQTSLYDLVNKKRTNKNGWVVIE